MIRRPGRPLRETADRVRDWPLGPLAERLGYQPDPRHRQRWRRDGSVLSIRGTQFFDHACGHGGGGAIDLVMHARRCGFRQAVAFLADGPPAPRPASPPAPSATLLLPDPVAALWPSVHDFLVRLRGLDPALLELCRQAGTLYADRRRNAVFTCRDCSGLPAGAELLGSRPLPHSPSFKALAPGSRRDRGGFWLTTGSAPPAAVLLTESAVDALSAVLLPAPGLPTDCLLASTAGTAPRLPAWLHRFRHLPLLCAYDADPAGDQAASALLRQHPRLRRLRPQGAKDWNDLLRLLAPCPSPSRPAAAFTITTVPASLQTHPASR